MTIISLLIAGAGLLVGLTALRAGEHAAARARLVAYGLQFPYGIKPEAVAAFLASTSGIAGPRWRRLFATPALVFETVASSDGIGHRLLVGEAHAEVVLAALRAHLPGVRVTQLDEIPNHVPTQAGQLGLSNHRRTLAIKEAQAVSTGILAALQPLGEGEQIVLQWVIQPHGPVAVVPTSTPARQHPIWSMLSAPTPSKEEAAAERVKRAHALFLATPRIGVVANSPAAAKALLGRVTASFHGANAPGAHLFRRQLPSVLIARNMTAQHLPLLVPPCLLNAAELAMLIGVPLGEVALPGLRLGGSRLLAPSADIPRAGRVLCEATFPGAQRPLALSVADSLRHLHVLGPTGVGKSTLLVGLITQDMRAGRGVVVIDPKGDLAADVLDRVPEDRMDDVILLDPADEDHPVGFNLLAGATEASELLVDQIVGTLHGMWAANWGPRTDDILRASLLTLITRPGMTLCEVPLLLTDEGFRRNLVGGLDDPVALQPFWAWYEGLSEGERTQAIGPVLNKLRAFLLRRKLRNVLGQATPRLDMAEVLSQGRILIVALTKGLLGEEAAALLGSLVIARLWQATMGRAGLPADARTPVFAYVDEFQDYLHLPTDIADVLAQARGLGLGLTLAHQHLGQLPNSLKEAVLANARSRVIFQTAASDASRLGREVAPYLTPADLQGLSAYEVAVTLSTGNRIAPPATGRTLPPPPASGSADRARAHSRATYGQPRGEVEAAIRARHNGLGPAGGVGRRAVTQ
jgi:Type IV secretion-system coupling protein DNA-binding domain